MEVPQERAAGEWQIEWFVLPNLLSLVAGALKATDELLAGLRVDAAAMRRNLDFDGGLIMAEAYMITLAPELGRENAHDLVYAAVGEVRETAVSRSRTRSPAGWPRRRSGDPARRRDPTGGLPRRGRGHVRGRGRLVEVTRQARQRVSPGLVTLIG